MNEKDLLENEELGRWVLLLLLLAMPNKNFEKELEAGNCDENHLNGGTEPKKAKWIEETTDIICSSCKSVFSDEIYYMCRSHKIRETMLFCPNCGAKMNAENNCDEKDEC